MSDENDNLAKAPGAGILEAVSHARQSETLRTLNPLRSVFGVLEKVGKREKDILISRFGLETGEGETLEKIGNRFNLTRERVRQIEKETLKKLKKKRLPADVQAIIDLVVQTLEENGNIATEERIIETLLSSRTKTAENAVVFILRLAEPLTELKETGSRHMSWYTAAFDKDGFKRFLETVREIFKQTNKPLEAEGLLEKIRASSEEPPDEMVKNTTALEVSLEVSKKISKNLFGVWGLKRWPEITPKDVGDKAYLALEHHGKPEHYGKITELINKARFDDKTAHKETVHNELIKDKRFVLVGRGIYALKKWGYKRGTVADIIEDLLGKAPMPMERDRIIEEVLKQRLVKRNTIIVGLADRERFKKLPDGRYTNV